MDNLLFPLSAILITAGFFVYFRIARKFRIVDLPNHRTMHKGATIRGGGIVVLIAMLSYMVFIDNPGTYIIVGLAVIGSLGFADDLLDLPGRMRLPLQFLAVVLIMLTLKLHLDISWFWLVGILIAVTGILNAYNFMDGINGMTGGYSIVAILSLFYINTNLIQFTSNEFLAFFGLTILIFNFFNFRKKAACFAGDVGSFTIAYILVFLILKLIIESGQPAFILLLTLYGIDTIFTIIERLWHRQNIFKAHRMHLFQVAVSRTGMPHLRMAGIYMIGQLIINSIVVIIIKYPWPVQWSIIAAMLMALSGIYIWLKLKWKTAHV
ncbi:MAG: UDP-GlcNAc--UDP-phosphate GlcNAc-1-phosphate transferase [Cyclobacteriaceae bacterium]|nr:UDP-GlcNAc--UDP-phosphate GlcNAc-1-phosphate transferase [Cyclobacteriaceae bacterium]